MTANSTFYSSPKNPVQQEDYQQLLRHTEWLKFKKRILERDNSKCRYCGNSNQLQVHHRQYLFNERTGKLVKPWAYPLNKLITLCTECHSKGHRLFKVPIIHINL